MLSVLLSSFLCVCIPMYMMPLRAVSSATRQSRSDCRWFPAVLPLCLVASVPQCLCGQSFDLSALANQPSACCILPLGRSGDSTSPHNPALRGQHFALQCSLTPI